MLKKIRQKSQGGFIGTILLANVLALSLGTLYVQKELERTPGVAAPVVTEAETVNVDKLLITPEDILMEKDQAVLSKLELSDAPSSLDPTIDVKDQRSGLDFGTPGLSFNYVPERDEVAGMNINSDQAKVVSLLSYNLPNDKMLLADEEVVEQKPGEEKEGEVEQTVELTNDITDKKLVIQPIVEKKPVVLSLSTNLLLQPPTPTPQPQKTTPRPTTEVKATEKPTDTPTITPTQKPTPNQTGQAEKPQVLAAAATAEPTTAPTPKPTTAATNSSAGKPANSLSSELIFQMINNHRAKIGKPAFEKDARLCSIAEARGPQLYDEIFVNHNIHAGFKALNLPYWITENMVSYGSEQANFNWWMNSSIHRSAIEGDYKYSCGTCWGNSCAQLFTSWVPK